MSYRRSRRGSSERESVSDWKPKTRLGSLVKEGQITSIEEIFLRNLKIREPEIVDFLVPDLKQEVVDVTMVQRQTDAGKKKRFRVTVVVGNENGLIGIGTGKAAEFVPAIRAAEVRAKLNLTIIRRGCGSWECRCDDLHSLPFMVHGKSGSVRVELMPAPRGTGLVTAEVGKVVLRLAGITDAWSKSFGMTRTTANFAKAFVDALKHTYKVLTPMDW